MQTLNLLLVLHLLGQRGLSITSNHWLRPKGKLILDGRIVRWPAGGGDGGECAKRRIPFMYFFGRQPISCTRSSSRSASSKRGAAVPLGCVFSGAIIPAYLKNNEKTRSALSYTRRYTKYTPALVYISYWALYDQTYINLFALPVNCGTYSWPDCCIR